MTIREDDYPVCDRDAARNLCILRELGARVLRDHPAKKSMRAKRKLAALDPVFGFSLFTMIPLTYCA